MNIITDLKDLEEPLRNPVLTIGNFDGVHRGHQALFEKVKERAKAIGGQSAVMTFEPHPIKVMKPGNGPPLITPTKQKLGLMWQAGIDIILCLPFTPEFAAISAEDFVRRILLDRIGAREIVVGYDYSFGYKREGNIDLLRDLGANLGFKVHVVDPIHINQKLVSSTSIRNLVREGNLKEAKLFLGRDYQISGTVIQGARRGGRVLGFPTANLRFIDELIPPTGVYAVTVVRDDETFYGVTNIGHNPTFGNNALSVETHLLDFSGDLLGKDIKINFLHRLRDEKAFTSIDDLSGQIALDIQEAKKLFGIGEKEQQVG
jgi:riboflavin kinase/FMN adenylyltransferase